MNRARGSSARAGRPRHAGMAGGDGFALVLTIALLGFLVLLVVALVTLTRVESSVAAHAREAAEARANARLALNLALGRLQAAAGADARVTASAEGFGGIAGSRFYTGVWEAGGAGVEPLTWLVSGNEFEDPLAVRPGAAIAAPVPLVGTGSALAPDEVVVPAQEIVAGDLPGFAGERVVGRYAWWVGDQGVKATVGPRSRVAEVSYIPFEPDESRRVLEQQVAADHQVDGVDVRALENAGRLRWLTSYPQLAWLDAGDGELLGDRRRATFHDWAVGPAAVLASTAADPDPRHRGLRRDLSLAPDELGAAFAAYMDFAASMEGPAASGGEFPPVPPIGAESPRRRYRMAPPVRDAGLTHSIAPMLTMFLLQFNVRTRNGSPASAEYEVRARMVASLWNPYTSALVPEPLWLEVDGLPTVTVQDSSGGDTRLALQSLFGGAGGMRIHLTPLEANEAFRGSPDDQSWLPGRVYSWRTRGGDAAGGWQTEFYHRTLSVANANLWLAPTGQVHAGDAGGSVTFSITIPSTMLTLRLRRAADDALLATYTSPFFEAPTPVPPYRDNEYRFGFPFRLVESFDTVLADPGLWLTTERRGFREAAPPAEIFRPFASGGNDPTLYVGMVTVAAPERLLDRVMGTTGMSYDEDVPLFELPRQPVLSLGELQHLAVEGARPFAIGNRWGADGGWNRLFDRYFFSGLAGGASPRLDLGEPLPNPMLRPLRLHPDGSTVTTADLIGAAGTGLSSKHLLLSGAFNVNSVRAPAWRAVLGSMRFPVAAPWRFVASTKATGTTAGDEEAAWQAVPSAAFLRFPQSAQETYRATTSGSAPLTHLFRRGLRSFSEAEWEGLAMAVAARMREKQAASGPFRTMEEFLGPLEQASFAGRSLLEAAIEDMELNRDVAEFSSQWLTQADVVTALAPQLFVRSDTFLVRAYGEVVNPATARIGARAWCEAVVQRYPDPLEPAVPGAPTDDEYQHPPGPFGRVFRIIDFRWISPFEL